MNSLCGKPVRCRANAIDVRCTLPRAAAGLRQRECPSDDACQGGRLETRCKGEIKSVEDHKRTRRHTQHGNADRKERQRAIADHGQHAVSVICNISPHMQVRRTPTRNQRDCPPVVFGNEIARGISWLTRERP